MSLVRNHEISINKILEKAVADDMKSTTKKFDFFQHIHSICKKVKIPEYLDSETNSIIENFKNI